MLGPAVLIHTHVCVIGKSTALQMHLPACQCQKRITCVFLCICMVGLYRQSSVKIFQRTTITLAVGIAAHTRQHCASNT